MSNSSEHTIVISDLLSFITCKMDILTKDKLLNCLKDFYSTKEIENALKTFLSSVSPKLRKLYEQKCKGHDSLILLYYFVKQSSKDELPIFVCKDLNNIPKPDSYDESSKEEGQQTNLINEQNFLKSQISEISSVVYQLKDQIQLLTQNSRPIPTNKIKGSGLAYLQKLIDEEENKKVKKSLTSKKALEHFYSSSNFEEVFSENIEDEQTLHLKANRKQRALVKNAESKNWKRRKIISPFKHSMASDVIKIKQEEEEEREQEKEQKIIHIGNVPGVGSSPEDSAELSTELNESESSSETEKSTAEIYLDTESSSRLQDARNATSGSGAEEDDRFSFIVVEQVFDEHVGHFSVYKCSLCHFSTNDASAVELHNCPQVRAILCCFCDTPTESFGQFNDHLKRHSKVKKSRKFDCLLCVFCCDDRLTFVDHLKTHSWVKPFRCSLCNFRCNNEFRIKSHSIYHREYEGSNSYFCHICTKVFGSRKNLDKHKFKHRRSSKIRCSYCNIGFEKRSSLHKHILLYSKGKSHLCSSCQTVCSTKKALIDHKRYAKH